MSKQGLRLLRHDGWLDRTNCRQTNQNKTKKETTRALWLINLPHKSHLANFCLLKSWGGGLVKRTKGRSNQRIKKSGERRMKGVRAEVAGLELAAAMRSSWGRGGNSLWGVHRGGRLCRPPALELLKVWDGAFTRLFEGDDCHAGITFLRACVSICELQRSKFLSC